MDMVDPEPGRGKSKRIQLALVDAALQYGNGETEEAETWTRSIPSEGRPGQVFYASACKALGLNKGAEVLFSTLIGGAVVLGVAQESFSTATGDKGQMTIYTVKDFKPAGTVVVDEAEVLKALAGKTAKEVFDMRGDYKGTPFAQILGNKAQTLKHFGGKLILENGVYKVTG